MSADYLLDMSVNACFDTMGMVKTEMTMRVILWNMSKEGKKKLHKVDTPAAQELKTVCFQSASCYEWDTRVMRLRRGDNPKIRATMEDEVLLGQAGSARTPELEDTNSTRLTRETELLTAMRRLTKDSSTSGQARRSWQMTRCSWRTLS